MQECVAQDAQERSNLALDCLAGRQLAMEPSAISVSRGDAAFPVLYLWQTSMQSGERSQSVQWPHNDDFDSIASLVYSTVTGPLRANHFIGGNDILQDIIYLHRKQDGFCIVSLADPRPAQLWCWEHVNNDAHRLGMWHPVFNGHDPGAHLRALPLVERAGETIGSMPRFPPIPCLSPRGRHQLLRHR